MEIETAKEQRVLEAAKAVFLRHGFRRVTMQDIAAEAGISRPALYLIFPNKEEVFLATIRDITRQSLRVLRERIGDHPTPEAQLQFAFEIWFVQPFELLLGAPDAKDLFDCTQGFAKPTMDQVTAGFESLLEEILVPLIGSSAGAPVRFQAGQVAHLLNSAVHGFKSSSATPDELRAQISAMIALITTALRAQTS